MGLLNVPRRGPRRRPRERSAAGRPGDRLRAVFRHSVKVERDGRADEPLDLGLQVARVGQAERTPARRPPGSLMPVVLDNDRVPLHRLPRLFIPAGLHALGQAPGAANWARWRRRNAKSSPPRPAPWSAQFPRARRNCPLTPPVRDSGTRQVRLNHVSRTCGVRHTSRPPTPRPQEGRSVTVVDLPSTGRRPWAGSNRTTISPVLMARSVRSGLPSGRRRGVRDHPRDRSNSAPDRTPDPCQGVLQLSSTARYHDLSVVLIRGHPRRRQGGQVGMPRLSRVTRAKMRHVVLAQTRGRVRGRHGTLDNAPTTSMSHRYRHP